MVNLKLADLDVSDNHPLALELTSLRNTVARFQDEAHAASIKLQRHSLDGARAHDRRSLLERENDVLGKEVTVLRAYPFPPTSPDFHPAVSQVRQLTLSLRQLSDKLSNAEEAFLTCTKELAHARGEAKAAKHAANGAYDMIARMRGLEKAETVQERELQWKLRTAEEQLRMTDSVVKEYSDLVRSLESKLAARSQATHGRNSASTTEEDAGSNAGPNRSDISLPGDIEGTRSNIQRLMSEFSEESDRLRAETGELQSELAVCQAMAEAQDQTIEEERLELAKVKAELQKLKSDDNTAAKMVSRYMKFSQASTDSLQNALTSLKARHAATIDTLSTQISCLTSQLQQSEANAERLRGALDELGGDYMKESYGRRREVALRIKLINREETLIESLRRWSLRGQEALAREEPAQETLARMVKEAKGILLSIDGPLHDTQSGSLARIVAAQTAADSLLKELQSETARRLELQGVLVGGQQEEPSVATNEDNYRETCVQCEATSSSVAVQVSPLLEVESSIGLHSVVGSNNNVHSDQADPVCVNDERALPDYNADHPGPALRVEDSNTTAKSETTQHISSLDSGTEDSKEITSPVTLPMSQHEGAAESPSATSYQVDNFTPESRDNNIAGVDDTTISPGKAVESENPASLAANLADNRNPSLPGKQRLPEIVIAHADESPQPPLPSAGDREAPQHDDETSVDIDQSTTPASTVSGTAVPTLPAYHKPVQSLVPDVPETPPLPQHPLLEQLAKSERRYDGMQRAFHDCHFALDELKKSLATSSLSHSVPPEALRLALDRLNDYIEDARVELEIRIADESLLVRGYQTLLSVPGALASPAPGVKGTKSSVPLRSEIEVQIEEFVSGTETSVQKAQETLARKLSDVQHDIAVLKRAVHDQEDLPGSPAPPEHSPPPSPSLPHVPASAPAISDGGWTSWIRGSSSRPSSPAPTFGSIMTSPQLQRASSSSIWASSSHTPRKLHFLNGNASNKDPLASLGFRVPMPLYVPPQAPVHPTPRSRTASTMYMVGLGSRTASGSLPSLLSPRARTSNPEPTTVEGNNDEGSEISDVE